jgi:hypothetical protein
LAKIGDTLVCPVCGEKFTASSTRQVYCSSACRFGSKFSSPHEKKKRRAPGYTIEEISRAARRAGLSYGDYVARVGL